MASNLDWVSTAERLPMEEDGAGDLAISVRNDLGVFVMGFWQTDDGNCYGEAYYRHGEWLRIFGDDDEEEQLQPPTHWRRWPAPPAFIEIGGSL